MNTLWGFVVVVSLAYTEMTPSGPPASWGRANDEKKAALPPGPEGRAPKPRRFATIYALLWLALVLPAGMLALSVMVTWDNLWAQAEDRVRHAADGAAEYASRVIHSHMMAADRISDATRGVTEAEIRADEAQWHRHLQSQIARLHLALDAKLLGADGSVLAAASASPPPAGSLATREYFTALERIPEGTPWVSQAIDRPADGRRFFAISRARHLPSSGAVMVAMDEARFGAGLARVSIQAAEIIAIIRRDGEVLTRHPQLPGPPPRLPPDGRLRQEMAQGHATGSFRAALPVTGEPMLLAYRQLAEHPMLYAVAVIPRAKILHDWWQEVWHVLAFGLLAMLALAALIWRVAQQQAALLDAKAELEARVAERSAQLADEGQRLSMLLDATKLGTWEMDMVRGTIWRSKRMREILSMPEALTHTTYPGDYPAIHPDDLPALQQNQRRVMSGEAKELQMEVRFRGPAGEWRWMETFGRVVRRDPGTGTAQIFTGVTRDITARKEAEARRELMIRELDHRAKNILAVIQSILRLSMREDPARYASRVQGRIAALSRAQAMLSAEAWSGADLAAILRGEMMPFARQSESENRFTLDGPPLRVSAQRVQPLVLAVHELASNAHEHGAFSRPEGCLAVSWQLDEAEGVIRLFWQETGGPPVTRPARHGVGGKLLTATIETQLHGSFVPEWHETGFAARITFPV